MTDPRAVVHSQAAAGRWAGLTLVEQMAHMERGRARDPGPRRRTPIPPSRHATRSDSMRACQIIWSAADPCRVRRRERPLRSAWIGSRES